MSGNTKKKSHLRYKGLIAVKGKCAKSQQH